MGWKTNCFGFKSREDKEFLSLHTVLIGSGAHAVSIPMVTRALSPRVKRPGREANQSHSVRVQAKETWIYIWTYGIQILGTASISNIVIQERFQSKALRMIVDASWYVPNTLIRRDLQIPSVKE
jgi:hypothetical protein